MELPFLRFVVVFLLGVAFAMGRITDGDTYTSRKLGDLSRSAAAIEVDGKTGGLTMGGNPKCL